MGIRQGFNVTHVSFQMYQNMLFENSEIINLMYKMFTFAG